MPPSSRGSGLVVTVLLVIRGQVDHGFCRTRAEDVHGRLDGERLTYLCPRLGKLVVAIRTGS